MIKTKIQKRILKHKKVRAKVVGNEKAPRISVFRSVKHIYAQVINDETEKTLVSFSDKKLSPADTKGKNKTDIAFLVGKGLGSMIKKANIKEVVFDRGGFAYHGRVKALAEGLRETGVKM